MSFLIPRKVAQTSTAPADKDAQFNRFYPASDTVRNGAIGVGMPYLSLQIKLREHLRLAKLGDRDRESRLVNRIGQIRRMVPEGLSACHPEIRDVVKEACQFLQSQGRRLDFRSTDPRYWISARGGGPRW